MRHVARLWVVSAVVGFIAAAMAAVVLAMLLDAR
jgi:hypothetical protein